MNAWIKRLAVLGWGGLPLSGCAVYDQAVLPSLTGEFRSMAHGMPGPDDTVFGMVDMSPQAAPIILPVADTGAPGGGHLPLAIIRFKDPNVDFDDDLRAAILQALSGKPDAGFGLVAVSPTGADATLDPAALQRNIERVLAAMTKAGVAEDRVIFTAASDTDATAEEVRVYLLDLTQAP